MCIADAVSRRLNNPSNLLIVDSIGVSIELGEERFVDLGDLDEYGVWQLQRIAYSGICSLRFSSQ